METTPAPTWVCNISVCRDLHMAGIRSEGCPTLDQVAELLLTRRADATSPA